MASLLVVVSNESRVHGSGPALALGASRAFPPAGGRVMLSGGSKKEIEASLGRINEIDAEIFSLYME